MTLARIHFAANDDRGNFTGRASAILIYLPDGDEIEFAVDDMPVERLRADDVRTTDDEIRIGGKDGIQVSCFGWRYWVGNMCWDATSISIDDAKKVARWLLSHGAVAESFTAGTWERIVREHEVRR